MLFVYKPIIDFAYLSVQILENQVLFGRTLRSLHYFSANLLVLLIFCHMLRVFFYRRIPKNKGFELDCRCKCFHSGSFVLFYRLSSPLGPDLILGRDYLHEYV